MSSPLTIGHMQLHVSEEIYKFVQHKIGNMKYEFFCDCLHVLQRESFLMRGEKDLFFKFLGSN